MIPHNAAFVEEAYQEKTRADGYNIVKKIRDMKTAHSRLLYIAEVKDRAAKSNLEKDLSTYFVEFQHKYEITGILLILNNYYIHLVEWEPEHFRDVVEELEKKLVDKSSIYKGMWVIHYW